MEGFAKINLGFEKAVRLDLGLHVACFIKNQRQKNLLLLLKSFTYMFCDKVGQNVVVSMLKKERCGTKDQLLTNTNSKHVYQG
jgi:hypothetical protein